MQDLEDGESDAFTEQRRVRHLTEVLVRNLSIPAAFVGSSAPGPSSLRPAYGRSAFSSFGATSAASAVGSSSGSSSLTERFPAYAPTQRSKDDLDLYIPSLHRRRSGRRKLTVSHGTRTASVISDGAVKDIDQPSSNGVPLGRRIDVKGKGRESNLASSRDTLNSIREAEQSAFAKSPGEQEVELDDSEVVFGWTSASRQPVPLQLQRSKSKSSLKSSSSKRSITSSVSKRFFRQNRRRRDSLVDTEDDDNEDSDDTEEHSPRKMTNAKYDRPTSPMSPHVSFQMSSDHTHAWSSGVDAAGDLPNSVSAASRRARSASRGSIFSVASGSSASTIRASAPFKHSEKEERFLRLKRYEDIRAHLVRSRLALCVPQAHSTDTGNTQNNLRPSMTRTRTISLPLRSHSAKDTMRSSPSTGAEGNPFYVSEPHKKSMEPSFPLDLSRTSLSLNAVDSASRCHRVIVQIWIESPLNPTYMDQGGKEAPWSLLLEWDVDLRRLISLGTDPRLFPRHLPANTLIFRTSNTEEYLTARLPSFMLSEVGLDTQEADTRIGRPFDNGPEEEGNLSDPGPVTSYKAKESVNAGALSYKKDGERERERLLARRRMILDRSVRETRMVQSVDDEELRRLVLQEQDIREARKELADLQNRMNDLLSREPFVSERRHSMRALSLQKLQGDKSKSKGTKEIAECQCRSKREALDRRRTHVKEARGILQMKEEALRQSKTGHLLDLEVHRSILLSASQRRANLISDLSNIFPVELVDAANVLFSICGIPLPNGDFESQISLQSSTGPDLDEDHVSSALGYVAQAVQLLAAYLTIPLYYPIRCMGSRSLVQDPISQMKGPKIFPLYSRGVDRYRFEYAVFLLNKDIEQIMLEHSIGVMDLTQTLPNLKNIYLTLSSDVTSGSRQELPMSGIASKSAQPIVLGGEVKAAKPQEELSFDVNSNTMNGLAATPNANGSIVSQPHGATISTLEKLLGSGWSSRSRAQPGNTVSGVSPVKGRRRNAETSKTMTLLGGRSSLNVTH